MLQSGQEIFKFVNSIKKLVIGKGGLLKDADYCFHSITRTDQKSSIIELIGAEDDGRKEKAEDDTLLQLGEESSKGMGWDVLGFRSILRHCDL